ncbi:mevalonate kinase [Talaromyces stipitatus ATCC 10500]|uniref:Mevalonate kinase n=1 Tax=Talaromyces stipitatus (strain ATCC 10500 / CBS 375.48 / QM 6759 / NRRL 1006) TaxID=441959 RepID=B8MK77_TALSN|nr:mevalonate kinase [Talaromyces stipitatus ATCC 10500]EED15232.1 mevalonate kinase [Talaromyces stipitatus ATCC 10500]
MNNGKGRKKHGSVKRSHSNTKRQQLTLSELQSRFESQNSISGEIESTDSSSSSSSGADGTVLTPSSTSTPDSVSNAQITPTSTATNANMSRTQMKRKQSSPMAPAFMVSAPGKVIVFGEHAVVHGKAAMAAAISLRSYLLVTTLSKSHRTVTLNFRDIGLDHTWDIDSLPWNVFKHPSKKKMYYDLVTELDPDLVEAVQPHAAAVSTDKPDDIRKIHQGSAAQFLYLFLSLGSPESHAAIYTLRSTIPISAGLGSSASVSVCLSAALLLQIRTLAGPHPDQPPEEAEVQIERINRWAFVGEMCIHGNPSGVDNTVSAGGKAVLFRRSDYSKPPTVTPLNKFPELPLLLVNTRQSRSTAVEVAKVGRLRETHPEVTEAMLDAIDKVTMSASEMIKENDFEADDDEDLEQFGALFRINHGLLVSLGVSHPRLERIRWTKLTGAGGGGCAITLIKPNTSQQTLQDLEEKLTSENFEKFETTLGGDGVGVLYPAVLRNGVTDEEGGEEIDQQKFENAVGMEGIERLVGVHASGNERREGWKFWKRAGGWTK